MHIFTLRHGQSVANVDENNYPKLREHRVYLTDLGHQQARIGGETAGAFARASGLGPFRILHSPLLRVVQTRDDFIPAFGEDLIENVFEDERLREQDFGLLREFPDRDEQKRLFPELLTRYTRDCEAKGKVYARPPGGESRLDVLQRVRQLKDMIMQEHRDEGACHYILIAHGIVNRALEVAFLRRDMAWFETADNHDNCQVNHMYGSRSGDWKTETISRPKP